MAWGNSRAERCGPASSDAVRRSMEANVQKGTAPELALLQALRDAGLGGFAEHDRALPGKPDASYPTQRVAVFMHGCFWHRCPSCSPPAPGGANAEYWSKKFRRNVERDAEHEEALAAMGWEPVVLWECMVKAALADCVDIVRLTLAARTGARLK